jgi:hypothetical protein
MNEAAITTVYHTVQMCHLLATIMARKVCYYGPSILTTTSEQHKQTW